MNLASNLATPPGPPPPPSLKGILRALAAVLGVAVGVGLYVAAFVRLTRPLHLEFGAGYWLGAGALFILIGLGGVVWLVRWHRSEGALGILMLLGGVVMLGVAWRRQVLIARARVACGRALAAAPDAHERIRVMYHDGVTDLPDLSRRPITHLSCRQLIQ